MPVIAAVLALAVIASWSTPSPALAQDNQSAVQLDLDGGVNGLADHERRNPNAVVRAYYTFISAGQFNEALALLGPSFGIEPVRNISSEMRSLFTRIQDGTLSISLDQVYQQGDWALAVLLIELANSDGTTTKLVADQYMMIVRGQWAVVPKQLRKDPSFSSFFNNNARVLNKWWNDNKQQITAKLTQG